MILEKYILLKTVNRMFTSIPQSNIKYEKLDCVKILPHNAFQKSFF